MSLTNNSTLTIKDLYLLVIVISIVYFAFSREQPVSTITNNSIHFQDTYNLIVSNPLEKRKVIATEKSPERLISSFNTPKEDKSKNDSKSGSKKDVSDHKKTPQNQTQNTEEEEESDVIESEPEVMDEEITGSTSGTIATTYSYGVPFIVGPTTQPIQNETPVENPSYGDYFQSVLDDVGNDSTQTVNTGSVLMKKIKL